MQVVGPLLGSYLDVPTVCLLSVDEPHDQFRMLHMWNREGSPNRPDVIRISDFVTPEYRQAARSGAFLVVHDTHGDPLTYASAHATLQVRAFMSVPFIRDGEWKFIFSVCDMRPHGWRDEEVSLFRQLADRLFARLEQALAEQAVANDLRDTQLLRDSLQLVSECVQAFFDAIVAAANPSPARAGCLQLLDAGVQLARTRGFDHDGPNSPCDRVTDVVRPSARHEPGGHRPFRRRICRSQWGDAPARGRRCAVRPVHTAGDARRADGRYAIHALERVWA
jgi:GAF domain-containing protein